MKQANRTNILIGGVDAMPPALDAVLDGRMHATVRNPSCRIHGGAILAGVAAVVNGEKTGEGGIPKHVITDGPVVTKENAPGMRGWRAITSSEDAQSGGRFAARHLSSNSPASPRRSAGSRRCAGWTLRSAAARSMG